MWKQVLNLVYILCIICRCERETLILFLQVIFIREGCSFCDIAMSEFRRVAKEVAYLRKLLC